MCVSFVARSSPPCLAVFSQGPAHLELPEDALGTRHGHLLHDAQRGRHPALLRVSHLSRGAEAPRDEGFVICMYVCVCPGRATRWSSAGTRASRTTRCPGPWRRTPRMCTRCWCCGTAASPRPLWTRASRYGTDAALPAYLPTHNIAHHHHTLT